MSNGGISIEKVIIHEVDQRVMSEILIEVKNLSGINDNHTA